MVMSFDSWPVTLGTPWQYNKKHRYLHKRRTKNNLSSFAIEKPKENISSDGVHLISKEEIEDIVGCLTTTIPMEIEEESCIPNEVAPHKKTIQSYFQKNYLLVCL